jgi:hypothetical protein
MVLAWSTLDSARAVGYGRSPSPPRRIGTARLSGTTSEWLVTRSEPGSAHRSRHKKSARNDRRLRIFFHKMTT